MVGRRHKLRGHEFEQTLGDGEGQRSLACRGPWGHKEWQHDLATEQQQAWVRMHLAGKGLQKIPCRRKRPPTPVYLPGNSHGQRSLVGYSPWGCERVRCNLVIKQQ